MKMMEVLSGWMACCCWLIYYCKGVNLPVVTHWQLLNVSPIDVTVYTGPDRSSKPL